MQANFITFGTRLYKKKTLNKDPIIGLMGFDFGN